MRLAGERGAERERTSQYAAGSRGSLYKARVSGLTEGRGPAGPRAGSRLLLGPAAPWKPGSPRRAEPASARAAAAARRPRALTAGRSARARTPAAAPPPPRPYRPHLPGSSPPLSAPPPAPGPRSAAGRPPGSGLPSPLRALYPPARRPAGFWRPWVDARGYKEEGAPQPAAEAMPDGPGVTEASGKLSQYRHPVRLFWPKSKCYDYLYQEAEALLKNFPIQATISFYEDSDSEDDIEELICEN
ncbi:protein ripply2 [Zalophus californianus]|uniref:Protein ripply2 n=1 Tax=Zalophus californianus TaxID=9704 RepID=A0A6J2DTI7_ZALCA|nr:protein ripply2 [Zalophus californianus]